MNARRWTLVRRALASAVVLVLATGAHGPVHAQASTRKSVDVNSPEYKRGRLLYIQCRACHDLQPSEVEKIGPNLAGLMGRKAAADAAFAIVKPGIVFREVHAAAMGIIVACGDLTKK